MIDKNSFDYYFNEDGEEQQPQEGDPNAQQGQEQPQGTTQDGVDPNAAPQQQAVLPDEQPDEDNKEFESKFPIETDGGDGQQDIINFTNFQKLQYFNKFTELIKFVNTTEETFKNAKSSFSYDELDDEKQHAVLNQLLSGLNEIKIQINFFLKKGIAAVNIDKTRSIFRSEIRKLNLIIDKFESLIHQIKKK